LVFDRGVIVGCDNDEPRFVDHLSRSGLRLMHELGVTNTQSFGHKNDVCIDARYHSKLLLKLIWRRDPAGLSVIRQFSA
jgi:hypothetical protein